MFEHSETIELTVDGMTCPHCQAHVENALKAVRGVKRVQVDLAGKCARVTFVPGRTCREDLVRAVLDAGYTAR